MEEDAPDAAPTTGQQWRPDRQALVHDAHHQQARSWALVWH
jgi:hypothetical protein